VEVATWHGLVTFYVLFGMALAIRRVQIAGITPHPTAAFMQQCTRQLTDPCDGFLLGKRYLLRDQDRKFTLAFDGLLKASGGEPILLPPRSPNLNAHCERFVRSIKEEALGQMIMRGEQPLPYGSNQYLAHYLTERNYQELGNVRIAPAPAHDRESGRRVLWSNRNGHPEKRGKIARGGVHTWQRNARPIQPSVNGRRSALSRSNATAWRKPLGTWG
jgi:hypothetical protein